MWLTLAVVALCPLLTAAVRRDQAGKQDWQLQLAGVGPLMVSSGKGDGVWLHATDKHASALIDLRTGQLLARIHSHAMTASAHFFDQNDNQHVSNPDINQNDINQNSIHDCLATIDRDGTLRRWQAGEDGLLIQTHQRHLVENNGNNTRLFSSSSMLMLTMDDAVTLFDAHSLSTRTRLTLPTTVKAAIKTNDEALVSGKCSDETLCSFLIRDDSLHQTQKIHAKFLLHSDHHAITATDDTWANLHFYNLASSEKAINLHVPFDKAFAGQAKSAVVSNLLANGNIQLGFAGKSRVAIYNLDTTVSPLKMTLVLESVLNDGQVAHLFASDRGVAAAIQSKTEPKTTRILAHQVDFTIPSMRISLILILNDVVIIQTRDGTLSAYTDRKLLWQRYEGLTSITASEFVELPAPALLRDHVEESSSLVQTYLSRWRFMATQLLSSFQSSSTASIDVTKRDVFGFRKLLVVATAFDAVYALQTTSGSVIWQVALPPSSHVLDILTIRDVSTTSKTTKVSSASVLLAIIYRHGTKTNAMVVNGLSGQEEDRWREEYDMVVDKVSVTPLKYSEDEDVSVVVLAARDGKVAYFPKKKEVEELVKTHLPNSFTYLYDGNGVKGYYLPELSGKKAGNKAWDFSWPKNQQLVASSTSSLCSHTASMGRVLGDRSVLYKYLNPHVAAYLTYEPHSTSNGTLHVYLLDTVSGSIIYHGEHTNVIPYVLKSAHVIQCENWFVYDYPAYNPRGRFNQTYDIMRHVSVLELYESEIPDVRDTSTNFSSYDAFRPFVMAQSYVFYEDIVAMGVSDTRFGITNREIIVALASNQIQSIPKRFLDPRRPMKSASQLTAEEKEEMVVPYAPVLEETPKTALSYDLNVMGITHLKSSPSSLESTSLVVAYGHDVFMTRITPSKEFDVLGDDFSRVGLVTVITALVGGIFISRDLTLRKAVRDAWK